MIDQLRGTSYAQRSWSRVATCVSLSPVVSYVFLSKYTRHTQPPTALVLTTPSFTLSIWHLSIHRPPCAWAVYVHRLREVVGWHREAGVGHEG